MIERSPQQRHIIIDASYSTDERDRKIYQARGLRNTPIIIFTDQGLTEKAVTQHKQERQKEIASVQKELGIYDKTIESACRGSALGASAVLDSGNLLKQHRWLFDRLQKLQHPSRLPKKTK